MNSELVRLLRIQYDEYIQTINAIEHLIRLHEKGVVSHCNHTPDKDTGVCIDCGKKLYDVFSDDKLPDNFQKHNWFDDTRKVVDNKLALAPEDYRNSDAYKKGMLNDHHICTIYPKDKKNDSADIALAKAYKKSKDSNKSIEFLVYSILKSLEVPATGQAIRSLVAVELDVDKETIVYNKIGAALQYLKKKGYVRGVPGEKRRIGYGWEFIHFSGNFVETKKRNKNDNLKNQKKGKKKSKKNQSSGSYNDKLDFAKSLGYKDISSAFDGEGGKLNFEKRFNIEG